MDNKEIAGLTGQSRGEGEVRAFKLNEVKMSGNTGEFSMREILGEKGEDGKYAVKELGKQVRGVILKMRWRLMRYEETVVKGETVSTTYMTSEFDFKNKDTVVLFNNGEKGIAAEIKAKYNLGTQRVLYVYIPNLKQTVRVIVKASGLTADKNPNGEMGLFEYVDSFDMDKGEYLHEYSTDFSGIYREDAKNLRKSYWAMTFKRGPEVLTENKGKIVEMIKEVHEKIGAKFAEAYVPPAEEAGIDYPQEDINPDDIPF